MDMNSLGTKTVDMLKRFRYPILVLAIGVVLMLLPGRSSQTQEQQQAPEPTQTAVDISGQLEDILSQIQGVGRVKVMLTRAAGESYLYHHDEQISASENTSSSEKDTVIITDADRNEKPLISQVLPPKYLGAIIVCQGAENAAVRLAVVEAVARVTGLGADTISVLKMK